MQFPEKDGLLFQSWDRTWNRKTIFWLTTSLALAAFLSLAGLKIAFSDRYVIQSDTRLYSLFLQEAKDKKMFEGDLIARYFDSVIPSGFKLFYQGAAWLGIDPFFLNKIFPLLFALILTCYCFAVTLEIFPVPLAGFIATVLLNQHLWTKEDISGGTPRSFAIPLFLPFLYYFIRKRWIPCAILIALQALFFPPTAMISLGMLAFRLLSRVERKKENLLVLLAAALLTAMVLVPYAIRSSEFGPVATRAEARNHPAFRPGGRIVIFDPSPLRFWLTAHGTGLFPSGMRPALMLAAPLLPFLWRWKSRPFGGLRIFLEVIAVSLVFFAAAHIFLFHLYNPGRYTHHTFPILIAIAAGISLTILLQAFFQLNSKIGWIGVLIGSVLLIIQFEKTLTYGFGYRIYLKGGETELYKFLDSQPTDTLVASLSREADNIPPFASRATLVGWKYIIPYHTGYFRQMQERGEGLIRAQYDEHLTEMKSLIRKYGVEFLLVDRNAFQPEYFNSNKWIRKVFQQSAGIAEAKLKEGRTPAMASVMTSCSAFQNERLVLLSATCVLQSNP